jgi:predicted outer membrane repeat protein
MLLVACLGAFAALGAENTAANNSTDVMVTINDLRNWTQLRETLNPTGCGGKAFNVTLSPVFQMGAYHSTIYFSGQVIIIYGNNATLDAGGNGAFFENYSSDHNTTVLELHDITLQNGATGDKLGGGIYAVVDASVTIHNTRFISNTARGGGGGAIYFSPSGDNQGSLSIYDSTFDQNTADSGGAIYSATNANVEIHNTSFISNTGLIGGAIDIESGLLSIRDSTFDKNSANSGGAVYATDGGVNVEIYGCVFKGNIARSVVVGEGGGAIYVYNIANAVQIYASEFKANIAGSGGAIYIADAGAIVEIGNTSFIANEAYRSADGGAIYDSGKYGQGTLTIYTDCNFTCTRCCIQTTEPILKFACPKGTTGHCLRNKSRNVCNDGGYPILVSPNGYYKKGLPPQDPRCNCTLKPPIPAPTPPPSPPPSPPPTPTPTSPMLDVSLITVGGLALLLATGVIAFATQSGCKKRPPDSTASDAQGLQAARHSLLAKDAMTRYSYLIDHSAVKLEPNGVIGRGAEGFVMRGKFNGARVAVKIVSLGMNENQMQSVVAEATKEMKLLQQLHHPNIVQLFGLAVKDTSMDTKLMLVMECCLRSLEDHLKDGHNVIQPVEVLGFLLDTCCGMMYLHSNGIIHRDLKPGNLLLLSDSNRSCRFTAKVADFGGSRFLQGVDGADVMTMTAGMGTPAYEAPECITGPGRTSKYSSAVDVYSFALTAWACVNRDTPFATELGSPWELRAKIVEGLRPEIDPAAFGCYAFSDLDLFVFKGSQAISKYSSLEAIAKDGWSADPQERPSFEELEPALRALSMAIDQHQEEEECEQGHRLSGVAVRRIPEGPDRRHTVST